MFNDNKEDLMNRQEFVNIICDILKANDGNFSSFAIDGKWGAGKTFILNMLENNLKDDYLIINFNAWENDFYDEPLIAILSCILEKLNEEKMPKNIIEKIGETTTKGCCEFIRQTLYKILEIKPIHFISNIVKGTSKQYKNPVMENTFDGNLNLKKIIELLRNELSKVTEKMKMLFIIDELDRCLPEYTLKTMERVHHIFNNLDGVITIYVIDKTQLSGMIKQYYGEKFDEKEYFEKLFSFSLKLYTGEISKKLDLKIKEYIDFFKIDNDFNVDLDIKDIINTMLYHVPARQKLSMLEQLILAHKLTNLNNNKLDFSIALFEVLITGLIKYYRNYYNYIMKNKYFIIPSNYGLTYKNEGNSDLENKLISGFNKLFENKVRCYAKHNDYPNEINVEAKNYYRSILLAYLNRVVESECQIILDNKLREKELFYSLNIKDNISFLKSFINIMKRLE